MRHLFKIDRSWVERRDALLRSEEDTAIRAAREGATGEERAFLDALLKLRHRNVRGERTA